MHQEQRGDPSVWEYDYEQGKYLNKLTGEVADEPDTDIPTVGTLRVADEEEEGFTVSEMQYRAGVRLAISESSGLVRRCPICKRRRLLLVPKEGSVFLTCGGKKTSLQSTDLTSDSENNDEYVTVNRSSVEDACNFERRES